MVGRGVAFEAVRLTGVTDLNPFIRGRARTLASLASASLPAGLANRKGTGEPVSQGDAALRALIEFCVASSQGHEDAARAGRRPRTRPRLSGRRRQELWQAAVRAQAAAWGQPGEPANEQITVMVNHMTHLAQKSPWFRSAPELREAAIEETIAYTGHGEAVESAVAHGAWLDHWQAWKSMSTPFRQLGDSPTADLRSATQERGQGLNGWLAEWNRWAEAHESSG